jgi:hypothetical protein
MKKKKLKDKRQNSIKNTSLKPPKRLQMILGKVYFAKANSISNDTRPRRRFVIVSDNGETVKVSKLKSIKKYNESGENADFYLVEIDYKKYKGLTQRTGVDNQVYSKNRRTNEKLWIGEGNGVFDEKEEFTLDKEDYEKVDKHVIRRGKGKKKGK